MAALHLNVQSLSGSEFTLSVDGSTQLQTLKSICAERFDCEPIGLRLVLGDSVLAPDCASLKDLKLQDGDTLTAVLEPSVTTKVQLFLEECGQKLFVSEFEARLYPSASMRCQTELQRKIQAEVVLNTCQVADWDCERWELFRMSPPALAQLHALPATTKLSKYHFKRGSNQVLWGSFPREIFEPPLREKAKCRNGHPLELYEPKGGWRCDGTHWKGACASGITWVIHPTSGVKCFACRACNFTLCEKCYDPSQMIEDDEGIADDQQILAVVALPESAKSRFEAMRLDLQPGRSSC